MLNRSRVDHNTSSASAGSSVLVLNSSQVEDNTANGGPMAGAGGIANGGTATISGSDIKDNTAPGGPGGGILNHGVMTMRRSAR